MHFLDHVFPLQYPVYKPGIQEGGRGWLLSALTQTKPLYHAALSLSAYHRWTVASAMLSRPCQIATLIQQEKHLEASIKSLNSFSHTYCHSGELSIIQTIIQLAFLEVLSRPYMIFYSNNARYLPTTAMRGRLICVQQRACISGTTDMVRHHLA